MKCKLCGKTLKKTIYYIDYHISKNSHSWEYISGLVENDELLVCKPCAVEYRNIMAKMFKRIGIKKWLKTIPYSSE